MSQQAATAIESTTSSTSRGAAREGRMAQYLTTRAAYKLGVGRETAREAVTPRLRLGLPTPLRALLGGRPHLRGMVEGESCCTPPGTARARLGRRHRTPAAGAAPRQHQEQGPGVCGAGYVDSGARDDLRVVQTESAFAQRPDRPGAAQRELRGGPRDGPVAHRAARRPAGSGELVPGIGEPRQAHG